MPFREGGCKLPKPLRLIVERADMQRCHEFAKAVGRKYDNAYTKWGKGFVKNSQLFSLFPDLTPQNRGHFASKVCEVGVRAFLVGKGIETTDVDFDVHPNAGDNGDLKVYPRDRAERRLNIKTRLRNNQCLLVRSCDCEAHRINKIDDDYYILTEFVPNDHQACEVWMIGWATKKIVRDAEQRPARVQNGQHYNSEIPDELLEQPTNLVDELRSVWMMNHR